MHTQMHTKQTHPHIVVRERVCRLWGLGVTFDFFCYSNKLMGFQGHLIPEATDGRIWRPLLASGVWEEDSS